MNTTLNQRLVHLVTDEDLVMDSGEQWVVLFVVNVGYLAAWVDEDGNVKTALRKSAAGAKKLADNSWGR